MYSLLSSRRAACFVGVLLAVCVAAGWASLRPSTGPCLTAATQQFLASLSAEQRAKVVYAMDTPQRSQWHYVPLDQRKGITLGSMSEPQRAAARHVLQAAVSQVGYDKARTIMELEKILKILEPKKPVGFRDPLKYWFAVFGTPDDQSAWQVSIEGHHLSLNFVVDHGRVVSHTPSFFGCNPADVKQAQAEGPPAGTRVLGREEQLGFDLVHALTAEQARQAIVAPKAPRDITGAASPQPTRQPPAGIAWKDLHADQQQILLQLIRTYVGNQADDVAAAQWEEIEKAGVENLHFAWAGAQVPGVGHFYRVEGPTFCIELCNTQPDGAGNPANHIHTVFRNLHGDFAIQAQELPRTK